MGGFQHMIIVVFVSYCNCCISCVSCVIAFGCVDTEVASGCCDAVADLLWRMPDWLSVEGAKKDLKRFQCNRVKACNPACSNINPVNYFSSKLSPSIIQ